MRLRKVRLPSHLLHGAKICWTRCSDSLHVQTKAAKIAAPGRRCPLKGNKPKQSGRQSTTTTPLSGAVATCRHRPPPQPKGLRPVPCRRIPRLDCADDPVYKPPARELALVRVSVYAGGGARSVLLIRVPISLFAGATYCSGIGYLPVLLNLMHASLLVSEGTVKRLSPARLPLYRPFRMSPSTAPRLAARICVWRLLRVR